jgi:4'-phosphopantetheinyl transferase
VWAVRLKATDEAMGHYQALLGPEERARAARFAFDRLRGPYELSHGVLRLLLSRYLNCEARDLSFTHGPRGKPALRDQSRIRFNMSHSGSLALYAFTADRDIGADVEQVREIADLPQIASRYFCQPETAQLLSMEGGEARQEAFFRCWTRKEAYIKAVGDGLSLPLDQFQVTLLPSELARFVHIGGDKELAGKWSLHHLDPARGYFGALAYPGEAREIRSHELLDPQKLLEVSQPGTGPLMAPL